MEAKSRIDLIMIRDVYITDTNAITPLGFDVATNMANLRAGISGIQLQETDLPLATPFYASVISDGLLAEAFSKITEKNTYTRLEKMMLLALAPIVQKATINLDSKTAFILSTTKGNISTLKNETLDASKGVYLDELGYKIANFFGFTTTPIVVSNACVSGILAVSVAKRLIQSGVYDHVFVVAGDEVSDFVVSGFNSFQAMSALPCKPYCEHRTGVSLGEAAAAVLVTANPTNALVKIIGDGSINDANHISGPSRTGEGLFRSINSALVEAGITSNQIDYISAHGTATPFNDEMEAIAFNRLNLGQTPVNSLKGYYGHTLGASGLLETVMAIQAIKENILVKSLGFETLGVSQPLAIIQKNEEKEMRYFLKTASGFGGCNSAVLFENCN